MSLQHRLEFAALVALRGLLTTLPERAALRLGEGLAAFGFGVLRYRRAEAVRRIRSVLGDAPGGRPAEAVAREAFRNFILAAVESMRAEHATAEWMARRLDDPGGLMALLKARSEAGRGSIVALPHMGSWELAGSAGRLAGIPLFSIAAAQKNPYFNAYLNRQRERSGIDILVRGESALRAIPRRLKAGKTLAILPDLRAPAPALPVPFLGSTANIAAGMAHFARQADVPIYVAILTRRGLDKHELAWHGPLEADPAAPRDEDLLRLTREVFARFDAAIRANPGQWFWFNKRWILDPVEPAQSRQ